MKHSYIVSKPVSAVKQRGSVRFLEACVVRLSGLYSMDVKLYPVLIASAGGHEYAGITVAFTLSG